MNSSPTPLAHDLWLLVLHGLPLGTVLRFAKDAQTKGAWSPEKPVTEDGVALGPAWLSALARSAYGSRDTPPTIPDDATLQTLLNTPLTPSLWDTKVESRSPLGETVLKAALEGSASFEAQALLWSATLWKSLPKATLENYRSHAWGGSENRSKDVVFRAVLAADQTAAAKVLLDRGWSWSTGAIPPAASIRSVPMWELFLTTGGDPRRVVEDNFGDTPVRLPLWSYLLKHNRAQGKESEALASALTQWAQQHDSRELEAKELADYWIKLGRRHNLAEVSQALRARKDWVQLKNPAGENALFVALRQHVGVVEQAAKTVKARPALEAVDAQGWSLWHHLLAIGKQVPKAAWAVAGEFAPRRPHAARGLLVTLYSHPSRVSAHEALPDISWSQLEEWSPKKPGRPSAEDWWAGSTQDLEQLARAWTNDDAYLGSFGTSSFAGSSFSPARRIQALAALAHAVPPPADAPPALLGALALGDLLTASYRGGDSRYEKAREWIAQGARLEMTPGFEANLDKILLRLPADTVALIQALKMNGKLAPAAPGRRHRM